MSQQIALPTVYNDFNAQLIQLESDNKSVVFNYQDKKENKAARSHVATLRKSKTAVSVIHKDAKAEALAECQRIDAGKNALIGRIDSMIEIHTIPLEKIKQEEAAAKLKIEMAAQAKIEAENLAIQKEFDHQAAILDDERRTFDAKQRKTEIERQAKINADQEASERIANDKAARIAAENKLKQVEEDAKQAIIDQESAAAQAIIDQEAAVKQAQAEAEKKAQLAEQARLAEEQRIKDETLARERNTEYKRSIHQAILATLTAAGLDEPQSKIVITMLAKGQIPYASINY